MVAIRGLDLFIEMDIIESDVQAAAKITDALLSTFNEAVEKALVEILQSAQKHFEDFAKQHTTYFSLLSGELQKHLGLPQGQSNNIVDTFINQVTNQMDVRFKPVSKRPGILEFGVREEDLLAAISSQSITTEKGENLPWADWLLLRGDSIIITEYQIVLKSGLGRSGGAIMVEREGKTWGVPARFAGTIDSNWFTEAWGKAFDVAAEDMIQKIAENLQ